MSSFCIERGVGGWVVGCGVVCRVCCVVVCVFVCMSVFVVRLIECVIVSVINLYWFEQR